MPKILISLVSDQTIPNVQLIKEFDFIDNYLFISTLGMEKKGSREWTIKCTNLQPEKILAPIIVNEHDFEDIEKKLAEFNFSDTDELFVNITGGTKIMSIVALDFFKELGAKIYYVTANKNEFIKVFPKSKVKNSPLKSEITVREYLGAYGFEIVNQGKITQNENVTNSVFQYFVQFFNPENKIISPHSNVFPALQSNRSKKKVAISDIPGLDILLNSLNFKTVIQDFITKDEIIYLSGGWFEEFIYNKIKSEFGLEEKFIAIGLNVLKKDVPNEFDVVFVLRNKIYTIECKTSVYYHENGKTKTTIGDFVYKCDSLQSELGLHPITAIATLSALMDKTGKVNEIAQTHYKRAELYKVNILAFSEISSGKSIKELLNIK